MEIRRQIAIIRARFPLVVVCVLLAATAAFFISSLLPKVFEAKATLIVGQSLSGVNPDYNQLLVSQRLSTTYAAVATKRPILEAVINQLGLDVTADELSKHVQANAPLDSTLLTISAQDADPTRAAALANALADQLIAASPAIQGRESDYQASIDASLKATQAEIDSTQAKADALGRQTNRSAAQETELAALEDRLASLRSSYVSLLSFSSGNAANRLTVIEPAAAPPSPVSPRPLVNTLLAAVLGLLVGAGVVYVVEKLDDKVKDAGAVQEVVDLSTLGTIARIKGDGRGPSGRHRPAALTYPRSSVAEAYRALRTNIEFAAVAAPIRTLLVTSSVPGEGKTITAANLAVVFAQAGRRVLLVDADLRKPGVHDLFDLPNAHGLTTLLLSDATRVDAIAQATEQERLRVLTTGPVPPNPAELLGSQRMRAIVDRLQQDSELVLFDSAPVGAFTDSVILSSLVDGTLLVIDAERSRRSAVRLGHEALNRAGSNVLGVVLNSIAARAHADYADWAYQTGDA